MFSSLPLSMSQGAPFAPSSLLAPGFPFKAGWAPQSFPKFGMCDSLPSIESLQTCPLFYAFLYIGNSTPPSFCEGDVRGGFPFSPPVCRPPVLVLEANSSDVMRGHLLHPPKGFCGSPSTFSSIPCLPLFHFSRFAIP